jgi:hypothetical protein
MDSACCLCQEAADTEFSPDITFNHPLTLLLKFWHQAR